jgi:hypothetical protein
MVHLDTGIIERLQVTADNSLVLGFRVESQESIIEITHEIERKTDEFRRLAVSFISDLAALPEKSRPKLPSIDIPQRGAAGRASEP